MSKILFWLKSASKNDVGTTKSGNDAENHDDAEKAIEIDQKTETHTFSMLSPDLRSRGRDLSILGGFFRCEQSRETRNFGKNVRSSLLEIPIDIT